jgi:hypothetical protein
MPYHPYTAAAKNWVQPNTVTRYDIEVFPTFAQLPPGHRIPSQPQSSSLAGFRGRQFT